MYLQMLGLGGYTFEWVPTEEALEQAVINHLHNIIRHVIHTSLFPPPPPVSWVAAPQDDQGTP